MKTIKFTKKQMEILFSCFHIGYDQTSKNNDNNLDNGFVKEKDINREHKIMDNVLNKITKGLHGSIKKT